MKKISVILPVYNEEEGIADFHGILRQNLDKLKTKYRFEIIYVVDRCGDRTMEVLKGIAAASGGVTVIGLSRRFGHQISLVAGLDHCSGDAAIMMDCDLEHPPELIPELLKQYEKGFDVVHTKRTYSGKVSLLKKLSSFLYYKVLNYLSSEPLNENSADFRLVSKKVIDVYKTGIREHNQFLRGLFSWIGFSQTTVPFTSGNRASGRSKYNIKAMLNFGVQGIISFSKVPLRLSITVGLITTLAGLLYGLYSVYVFFSRRILSGYTSIIILVILFGGIQLIVLGVIGEYISAIFDEAKNRPLYIVDEYYPGLKRKLQK